MSEQKEVSLEDIKAARKAIELSTDAEFEETVRWYDELWEKYLEQQGELG